MGDLMSKNYDQASRRLSFFNPYRFIYFFESYLLKKYEETCFNKFDKILLLFKKEIKSINSKFKIVTNEKNIALIEIISKFVSPGLFVITYLQKLIDTKNCIVKIQ